MNGIITLENMSNEYVQLEGNILYEMVDKASKIVGSIHQLSKLIKINYGKLLKFHYKKNRQKSILLTELRSLSNFLVIHNKPEYNLDRLRIRSIGKYGGISFPEFPIDFRSIEGVTVLADILTDGCISYRHQVSYTNTDPLQIADNIICMNLLFCKYKVVITNKELRKLSNENKNLKTLRLIAKKSRLMCRVYINVNRPKPIYSVRYSDNVGKLLELLGIPKGRKIYSNPVVPEFLFSLNKDLIFKFLERVIINEGWVSKTKVNVFHVIDVTKNIPEKLRNTYLKDSDKFKIKMREFLKENNLIPNLILDYKRLSRIIGCKSSEPQITKIYIGNGNEIRTCWTLAFTGNDLDILRQNLDLKSKLNKKLSSLLERKNMNKRFSQEERLDQIMKVAGKLKVFKSRDISQRISLCISSTVYYLNKLAENGKITIVKNSSGTTYRFNQ